MATTKIRSSNQLYIDNNLDLNNFRLTNLATPTVSTDAATKAYVDAVKTGLDIKDSVRAASTGNLTSSGNTYTLINTGANAAFTLDGVNGITQGTRVLIKDQTTQSQNGIYVVSTVGDGATPWVLTRASDFDNTPGLEVTPGAFCFVEEGTVNSDSGWVLSTNGEITIGTTSLTFTQFSGAGQITAGDGLTKTGNAINVVTASSSRIVVNADNIDLAVVTVTPATTGTDTGFINSVTVDSYGRVTGYNKANIGTLTNLNVSGTTTLNTLNVTGNETVNNLTVTGSTNVAALTATGLTSLSNLTSTGTTNLAGVTFTPTTGTAPFSVSSATKVTNLNADLLDGNDSTYFVNTGRTVSAGTGLSGGGSLSSNITISHGNTSDVANLSSNNSGGTVIQDISLIFDEFGHTSGATVETVNLDNRYLQTGSTATNSDKLDGFHATELTNAFRKYRLGTTAPTSGNTVTFSYSGIVGNNVTIVADSFELFKNGLLLNGGGNDYMGEGTINGGTKTITFTVTDSVITSPYSDVFLLNFSYTKTI